MCVQYHPDKNLDNKEEAERKFKQLTEAYEVLGDKKKRQEYDLYGEAGPNGMPGGAGQPGSQGGGFQGGNPADFQEFFNFGGPNGGGFTFKTSSFGGGGPASGFQGFNGGDANGFGDIFSNLFGGMGNMGGFPQQQSKSSAGFNNNNFGFDGGASNSRRKKSKSSQQSSSTSPSEPLAIKIEVTLEDLYKGRLKKMKVADDFVDPKTGRKSKFEKVFPVTVEAGAKAGSVVSFTADDEFPRAVNFELVELPHKQFTRKGSDIVWKCPLSLRQIEKGVMISVPLLDGKTFMIETKEYTIRPKGTTSVPLDGYGLPIPGGDGKKRGKLIVQFSVKA